MLRQRIHAGASAACETHGHTNVAQHTAGYFKDRLDTIKDYRRRLVPSVIPVTLLRRHVRRFDMDVSRGINLPATTARDCGSSTKSPYVGPTHQEI